VYYNDIPIGNFTCRLEPEPNGRTSLYLMTMGILAVRLRLYTLCASGWDVEMTRFLIIVSPIGPEAWVRK
jgi:hypothetical protein